ncbi:hypothetical protein [Pseudomonas sp.]|uniref:hypothetical protein n=1 Tax=Pseudomonas sp. TaxID=306 RepID=UPI0026068CB0|nr:hypothetical protein [Pseudomonas sp.]
MDILFRSKVLFQGAFYQEYQPRLIAELIRLTPLRTIKQTVFISVLAQKDAT